jgi:hypothetical protein
MNGDDRLLEVELCGAPEEGCADEALPLTVVFRRPAGSGCSAYLKHVDCTDKQVELDTDSFPGCVGIGPGEEYRLTLPLRVPHPKLFDVETIVFQVGPHPTEAAGETPHRLPNRLVPIHPAIGREIDVEVKAICSYAGGTKVQVTLRHLGRTQFGDFTATLGPEATLRAGKRVIKRDSFDPNDRREQSEVVVVVGHDLEIELSGTANGRRVEARLKKDIPRPPERLERRFQFLDPRQLSLDAVTVIEETSQRHVPLVRAAYPLHAEEHYEIEIRPQLPGVTRVKLRDIPGAVHVLKEEEDRSGHSWKFTVEVTPKGRFSRSVPLFYDVETAESERLVGEIHVCLRPARLSYLFFAITLGAAVTLQGLAAVAKVLFRPEYSLEDALEQLHPASNYHLWLAVLSIPLAWVGMAIADRLQSRLRS